VEIRDGPAAVIPPLSTDKGTPSTLCVTVAGTWNGKAVAGAGKSEDLSENHKDISITEILPIDLWQSLVDKGIG